jgi:opacity protein-like surface antigen
MGRRRTERLSVFALLSLLLAFTSLPANAEMYVAGQVGVNIPYSLSNVEWSAEGATVSGSDLSLQNSLMYGAKAGYYFDSLKWQNFNLGVETEVFNATPHLKQQDWIIEGQSLGASLGVGTIPGLNFRVLTWAPANIVVRYQAGAFEPYAGVGLGVFFSHLSSGSFSSSSTDVGLNTQVGLKYRVTDNVALFGEWKFNRANINHDNLSGTGLDLSADYTAHNLVFGVGYHF